MPMWKLRVLKIMTVRNQLERWYDHLRSLQTVYVRKRCFHDLVRDGIRMECRLHVPQNHRIIFRRKD